MLITDPFEGIFMVGSLFYSVVLCFFKSITLKVGTHDTLEFNRTADPIFFLPSGLDICLILLMVQLIW